MSDNQRPVSKIEAMRLALQELKNAAPEELSAYLEMRFGLKVAPPFIPVLKASVLELEHLERARQAARAVAEEGAAKKQAEGQGVENSGQEHKSSAE